MLTGLLSSISEQCSNETKPKIEKIDEGCFKRFSSENFERSLKQDVLHGVKVDQEGKKRELTNNLHYFNDKKDKELDRQIKENAEIASETEKENKQFNEILLARSDHSEEQLESSTDFNDLPPEQLDVSASSLYGKVPPNRGCLIS